MHVDNGMIPIHSGEPVVEESAVAGADGLSQEEESRVAVLERTVARQEKRISDLERYSKLQTCSIEQLFSITYSLQDANEKVRYMRSSSYLVSSQMSSSFRQLSLQRFVVD